MPTDLRRRSAASATSPRKSLIPAPSTPSAEGRGRRRGSRCTMAYSVAPWPSSRLSSGDELAQLERNPLEHSLPPIRTCRPALSRHCLTRSIKAAGRRRSAPRRGGSDHPFGSASRRPGRRQSCGGHPHRSDAVRRAAGLPRARRQLVRGALPRPDGSGGPTRRTGDAVPGHELGAHALHALPDRRRLPRRRAPHRRDQAGAPPVADGRARRARAPCSSSVAGECERLGLAEGDVLVER